ncbi:hypothetical protein ACQ4PT_063414 [Festuca glaucescens]
MYGGGSQHDGNGGAANANNQFDGDRFMPPQTTSTPEGGSAITRTRGAQALLSLTVKQIMDASQTNDGFAVNGTEVRLVGRMLNKKQQVTDVSFVLDDGTGMIEMKRWDNETFDTEEMKLVKDGDYVIVIGGLKDFQGKRQVTAFSVRLVTNYNDITHHFLHCIYVHLDLARPKPPTSSASGNTAGKELSDLVMSVFHDPVLGLTVLHLVDLGNLYATIDDDHYKSTMNG